jgi:hypothetical protein
MVARANEIRAGRSIAFMWVSTTGGGNSFDPDIWGIFAKAV